MPHGLLSNKAARDIVVSEPRFELHFQLRAMASHFEENISLETMGGDHPSRELERTTRGRPRKDKSAVREPMVDFEKRLAKVELVVAEHHDCWEELDPRMTQLGEELQGDMLGTLNEAMDRLTKVDEENKAMITIL